MAERLTGLVQVKNAAGRLSTSTKGAPMRIPCSVILLLLLAGVAPAEAQRRPAPLVPRGPAPAALIGHAGPAHPSAPAPGAPLRRARLGNMVAGGVVGGVLGAIVGAAGAGAERSVGDAVLGSGIGMVAGAPVGVHLGNAAHGDALLTLGAGIGAGAVALWLGAGETDYRFLLPVSGAAALLTAVAAEARATR